MKVIFIISILLILSFSCLSNSNENELELKAVIKGVYKFEKSQLSDSIYYLIEIKIINISSDDIGFLAYDCSTAINVISNNKYVRFCPNNCGANAITVINLKPKEEFSFPLILKSHIRNPNNHLNIGWILLNKNMIKSGNYLKMLEKSKSTLTNVIWGNQIELSESGGIPIEIN